MDGPLAEAPQRQDVTFRHTVVTSSHAQFFLFMLACTRLARRVCCPRLSWHTAHCTARLALIRNNSSLAPDPPPVGRSSPNLPPNENEDGDNNSKARNDEPLRDVSYSEFKATVGEGYRHASTRNWLGGEVVEFVFAWPSRSSY